MSKVHPEAPERIAAYIAKHDGDRRKMLETLRQIVMDTDPQIQEDWKWGAPGFNLQGLVCWLVNFKDFVGVNFYKGSLIEDAYKKFEKKGVEDKHNRLVYFRDMSEIKEEEIRYYVSEAIRLNREGIKPKPIRKEFVFPDAFMDQVKKDAQVLENFEKLSYSRKKDYHEWITSAKREETKIDRIEKSIAFIRDNVDRHAKYRKK